MKTDHDKIYIEYIGNRASAAVGDALKVMQHCAKDHDILKLDEEIYMYTYIEILKYMLKHRRL